jgi:RNA polymerase sigma factor (sigma-70 family)
MAKRKNNYINNKDLYAAMVEHREKLKEALDNDKAKPKVSEYIGKSILLICNNLAKKPNFSGYTYKQEMISDGIIDCISAVDNFDPNRTSNPFAYFTQIAWNAFLRRIHKEKKQTYIKHKNFENTVLLFDGAIEETQHLKTNEFSEDLIRNFENKLTKPKKEVILSGIEKFSEDSNDI